MIEGAPETVPFQTIGDDMDDKDKKKDEELTPMMKQYLDIKKEHQDKVLFFRLGDFYEMFSDDALEVSKLLNLTLTHRGKAPMCGIPYHAAKNYTSARLASTDVSA